MTSFWCGGNTIALGTELALSAWFLGVLGAALSGSVAENALTSLTRRSCIFNDYLHSTSR